MLCPAKHRRTSEPADLVNEVLQEIASHELTLELITNLADEARWNKLIQKHHYLKEHHLVGESLQ